MERIFTKIYNTPAQELRLRLFGLLLIVSAAAYFVSYVVFVK